MCTSIVFGEGKCVLFREVPLIQCVLLERFHCIANDMNSADLVTISYYIHTYTDLGYLYSSCLYSHHSVRPSRMAMQWPYACSGWISKRQLNLLTIRLVGVPHIPIQTGLCAYANVHMYMYMYMYMYQCMG